MIYLDYQATTPLAPEARSAMLPWLTQEGSANPHSAHAAGRAAKAAIEVARDQVAALLPHGGKLYFTSGATEALNWALRGSGARRIGVLATEHAAVLDTASWLSGQGCEVIEIGVGADGLVAPDAVPPDLDLLAAMLVNNEIGVIQPIAELTGRARLMLCDAVQGYGRMLIPGGADYIAISAHKIHGPKGIGALWVRDGAPLEPLLFGGGQEGGLRSGTLSPGLCAGFGAAAAVAKSRMTEDAAHVARLWEVARARLDDFTWAINGSTAQRWHGNINARRRLAFDVGTTMSVVREVAFSAGSACASGSGRPSHVLKAIGLSDAEARSSLRIGFGRYTTEAELEEGLKLLAAQANMQDRWAMA